jgi:hypothetical protein
VLEIIRRSGLDDVIGSNRFFHTIDEAIEALS